MRNRYSPFGAPELPQASPQQAQNFDPAFPLLRQAGQLQTQIETLSANLSAREKNLQTQERMRQDGSLVPGGDPRDLKEGLAFLPPWLSPGNVGQINDVLWPFFFTFTAPELPPNSNDNGTLTITQEAAFVWMSMTKVVFKIVGDVATAIDPNDSGQAGLAPGLAWTLTDAQSTRLFTQQPVSLDSVGHPEFPTVLPTPLLFLPNSTVRMGFTNTNATATYVPFVTLFGYRIRIEDAKNMLSTIRG